MKRLALFCLLLAIHLAMPAPAVRAHAPHPQIAASAEAKEEVVFFNVRSHKYHCLTCGYARRCTANCIEVPVSEARKRGGVPCKICGGSCRR